jgi:hypothetical protein
MSRIVCIGSREHGLHVELCHEGRRAMLLTSVVGRLLSACLHDVAPWPCIRYMQQQERLQRYG